MPNFCRTKLTEMKKTILGTAAVYIMLAFTACIDFGERINGNGNFKKETRNINEASRIRVLGSMDVFIASGPASVTVEADENIIPYILTDYNDNWLEVKTRNNVNIHTNNSIKVFVTTPDIKDLRVSGSGNITCNDKFASTDAMSFKITGSGNIKAEVNTPKIDADITGSGNLNISGETRDVDIRVTGSGNYDGPELKAESAIVKVTGSGDVKLFADASLKATISGSGDVRYKGNPTIDKHIAGSGTIRKMD